MGAHRCPGRFHVPTRRGAPPQLWVWGCLFICFSGLSKASQIPVLPGKWDRGDQGVVAESPPCGQRQVALKPLAEGWGCRVDLCSVLWESSLGNWEGFMEVVSWGLGLRGCIGDPQLGSQEKP